MKNKYTVITKNAEFSIVEVQQVEAENPKQAYKVAVKQIIDQMICDSGDLSKSEKFNVIDNEELICVLEGHSKCVLNSSFE
jgi:hypothetical protein